MPSRQVISYGADPGAGGEKVQRLREPCGRNRGNLPDRGSGVKGPHCLLEGQETVQDFPEIQAAERRPGSAAPAAPLRGLQRWGSREGDYLGLLRERMGER